MQRLCAVSVSFFSWICRWSVNCTIVWILLAVATLVHEVGHQSAMNFYGYDCEEIHVGSGPVLLELPFAGRGIQVHAFPIEGSCVPVQSTEFSDTRHGLPTSVVFSMILLAGPILGFLFAVCLFQIALFGVPHIKGQRIFLQLVSSGSLIKTGRFLGLRAAIGTCIRSVAWLLGVHRFAAPPFDYQTTKRLGIVAPDLARWQRGLIQLGSVSALLSLYGLCPFVVGSDGWSLMSIAIVGTQIQLLSPDYFGVLQAGIVIAFLGIHYLFLGFRRQPRSTGLLEHQLIFTKDPIRNVSAPVIQTEEVFS